MPVPIRVIPDKIYDPLTAARKLTINAAVERMKSIKHHLHVKAPLIPSQKTHPAQVFFLQNTLSQVLPVLRFQYVPLIFPFPKHWNRFHEFLTLIRLIPVPFRFQFHDAQQLTALQSVSRYQVFLLSLHILLFQHWAGQEIILREDNRQHWR